MTQFRQAKRSCILLQITISPLKWNHDKDMCIHTFKAHQIQISKFINAYKGKTAKLLKKNFLEGTKLWKEHFWNEFCLPQQAVPRWSNQKYIESQGQTDRKGSDQHGKQAYKFRYTPTMCRKFVCQNVRLCLNGVQPLLPENQAVWGQTAVTYGLCKEMAEMKKTSIRVFEGSRQCRITTIASASWYGISEFFKQPKTVSKV